MHFKHIIFGITFVIYNFQTVLCKTPVFDEALYSNVLNSELCSQQLGFIKNDSLLFLKFLDAGPRIPRGIQHYNFNDMGSYFDCININEYFDENSNVEGKYCSINLQFPNTESLTKLLSYNSESDWLKHIDVDENTIGSNEISDNMQRIGRNINGIEEKNSRSASVSSSLGVKLAICIPKTCTAEQGFNFLLANVSIIGINITENYCRLPNDKPNAPVNYVAIVIFSLILAVTIASTAYDALVSTILKKDSNNINKIYTCCSVVTNSRRLLTYKYTPGNIECLDGIRAISMIFVFTGHTFSIAGAEVVFTNLIELLNWLQSFQSIWIKAAPLAVDTFLLISGILVVYSTIGKMSASKLLKNLHFFYMNRILRLFPLLAATILLQTSLFHYITDGPKWSSVGTMTQSCRSTWWSTLLYVQNYATPNEMCLPQTWYLAVDMQLYVISPIILLILLKTRRFVWLVMAVLLIVVLSTNMIYNFHYNFYAGLFHLTRSLTEANYYMQKYYYNTFTRASPFIVGMMFGYLLHLTKDTKVRMNKIAVGLWWLISAILMCLIVYVHNSLHKADWDYQVLDNLLNTFMRPLWAAALGWVIFACEHGYSGPINWFLSLTVWKVPSRLSYALYLTHYSVLYVWYGAVSTVMNFSPILLITNFLSQFVITYILSFVLTVLVDAPVGTLVKILMGGERKRTPSVPAKTNTDLDDNIRV